MCYKIKINVNATLHKDLTYFGVGIVGRDDNGVILFAIDRLLHGQFESCLVKAYAVLEGCLAAQRLADCD